MKSLLKYIRQRRERKLRERCIKYAVESHRGSGHNGSSVRVSAKHIYEYIVKGTFQL